MYRSVSGSPRPSGPAISLGSMDIGVVPPTPPLVPPPPPSEHEQSKQSALQSLHSAPHVHALGLTTILDLLIFDPAKREPYSCLTITSNSTLSSSCGTLYICSCNESTVPSPQSTVSLYAYRFGISSFHFTLVSMVAWPKLSPVELIIFGIGYNLLTVSAETLAKGTDEERNENENRHAESSSAVKSKVKFNE